VKSYIKVPVANMHRFPQDLSEVVSQANYSEEITLLEAKDDWSLIQTDDSYQGWIKSLFIIQREPLSNFLILGSLFNHIYRVTDTTPHPPLTTLPFQSKIELTEPHHSNRWLAAKLIDGTSCYVQQGDLYKGKTTFNTQEMISFAQTFLGLPYTWGGKSSFGYDCSGLVQMLFRFRNILLPRDSKDQAQDPCFITVSENERQPGDLLFFGSSSEKISHVALCINNDHCLHATVALNSTKTIIHPISELLQLSSFPFRLARRLKS
jgi:cell wall-associated NlpC family hydrolase